MSDVDVCAESRRRRAGKAREGGGEREPESQGAREAKVRKSDSERLRMRALAVGETPASSGITILLRKRGPTSWCNRLTCRSDGCIVLGVGKGDTERKREREQVYIRVLQRV